MAWEGPEPPEDSIGSVSPPDESQLTVGAVDSDEEESDNAGYHPLHQGPDGYFASDQDELDDEEMSDENEAVDIPETMPPIEPVDREVTREVWSVPRSHDPIVMDSDRAQQVMTAMANFVLPNTSIPEWAQSVSEDQWRQRLQDKIDTLRAKQ